MFNENIKKSLEIDKNYKNDMTSSNEICFLYKLKKKIITIMKVENFIMNYKGSLESDKNSN